MSQPPAPAEERSAPVRNAGSSALPASAAGGGYLVKRGDTLYRIALEHGLDYRELAAWNGIAPPYTIREGQSLRVSANPGGGGGEAPVQAKPVGAAPLVETRPLEPQPVAAAAAPVAAAAVGGGVKREPRAGKEPYSDEAYARLNRLPETPKVPEPAKPVDVVPSPAAAVAGGAPAAAVAADELVWAWPTAAKLSSPFSEVGSKGLDFAGKAGDPVLAAADGKVVYAGAGLRGYGELVIVKHNATFLSAYAHNRKILVREGQQVTRGQKIAEMGNTDADSVKLHFEIRKQGKPVDPAQFLPKR
ncbi:peptidoglycan DD-metalloendopeptidase family protein [Dechloromonas sp. ZY10]|uniref:peptidoglycan DD-metalloendopeptidase family protein n=1 Tax=Dechloromonas aquae TaxID=2664436 RepID=UPI003529C594